MNVASSAAMDIRPWEVKIVWVLRVVSFGIAMALNKGIVD